VEENRSYSIGDLSRRSGLSVRTIRFSSDVGVVPASARSASGYRLYDVEAVARLDLVRTLAKLGLVRPEEERERLFVACACSFEQLVIVGHRLGSQRAISPACGLETTLRQPDGPSRGSRSTTAPSSRARSVERSIRSTST
jgi:MerR HTH family regulatory protein